MTCPRCAALQERIEELEYELGVGNDVLKHHQLEKYFRIRPQIARILMVLYAAGGRCVPDIVLFERMGSPLGGEQIQVVKVQISRLRKAVPESVETIWGRGYRITDAGKRAIEAAPAFTEAPHVFQSDKGVSR
jgi:DNA-binding response OmpR family regulator